MHGQQNIKKFPYTFGELLETITSVIQTEEMMQSGCCATPQTRPYNGNMFVQLLPYKLPDQVWTASQTRTVILYLTDIHLCHGMDVITHRVKNLALLHTFHSTPTHLSMHLEISTQ